MKLSVIGTGYVGLVTGGCFADHGNQVICVDNNPEKLKTLRQGQVPFFEPGLETIIHRNIKDGRITFTDQLDKAVAQARIHFICVGTPYNDDLGTLDTRALQSVALTVAKHAKDGDLLVIKSTVPAGTAMQIRQRVNEAAGDKRLHIVNNPEFLKEGNAVEDFMKPDRVVVGVDDENGDAAKLMNELYGPFVRTGNPILCMDNSSAEMVKLASNGYLATRISYINEIANLCETVGANVAKVRQGMGLDQRIGHRYLFPGLGYGGSCFPKDIQALMHMGQSHDGAFGARILTSVHEVNLHQRTVFIDKIRAHFGGKLSGKKIAVWGLAFKPNTDDIRDAPSIDILQALCEAGAQVRAYDPEAMKNIGAIFGDKITLCENNYACLEGADALCVLTEWGVFRNPDFEKIKAMMRQPVIFDGRNLYNQQELAKAGFSYFYVGQPFGGRPR